MAQVAAKRPLVAVLSSVTSIAAAHLLSGFRQGLQELGYVEGRNIDIVHRYADGDLTRIPALADELVRLKPEVIVCETNAATVAFKQATTTIPIVNAGLNYPESFGLITSMARRGGQVTGILSTLDSLPAKQLQMMLELLPGATSIGFLLNASNPTYAVHRRNAESAAASFARQLVPVEVNVPDDLDAAFQAFMRERVDLVLILGDAMFVIERRRIATLAIAAHLPAMYAWREHVEDGGLMSYGIDLRDSYRHAAVFVDKILKGANPADLPVEQPTKFELIINLKTATALGITIPPSVMVRADEVIE